MVNSEITSGDMASLVDEQIATAKQQEEAMSASNTTVTQPAVEVVKEAKNKQEEALAKAPRQIGDKALRGRRAKDNVGVYLDNLKTAKSAHANITAWSRIIDIVVKYPKKSILDQVLKFFKENVNESFLQEQNALQGITTVEMTMHHRIRIFYTVMIGLARGTASRKNTSIDVIRNIFSSDDLANWTSIQLSRTH